MQEHLLYPPSSSLEVNFFDMNYPGTTDGNFQVTGTLSLSGTGIPGGESFNNTLEFSVNGPRYALDTSIVSAVYPPDGSRGDYRNFLPHLVLNRSTLPWERSPSEDAESQLPWLFLLMLRETEIEENPVTATTAADHYPNFSPEPGQSGSDPVFVLNISTSLATSLLPSYEDLSYIAHTRKKQDSSSGTESKLEAVVLGNRLAYTAGRVQIYLVSLEDLYENEARISLNGNTVQLPVLYQWGYTSYDPLANSGAPDESFSELLSDLNRVPSTLRLPEVSEWSGTNPETYLAAGKVPVPHQFRNGQQSVSWFRSPLATSTQEYNLPLPAPNPDSLYIYSEVEAMFDITYGSAWEMGRLLALANTRYSNSLYHWKRKSARLRKQAEQRAVDAHLPALNAFDLQEAFMDTQSSYFPLFDLNQTGATITDSLSGAINATLSGSLLPVPDRQFGACMDMSEGDSAFYIADLPVASAGKFTLSFWAKLPAETNGIEMALFGFRGSNSGTGADVLWGTSGVSMTVVGQPSGLLAQSFAPETWNHFTLTVSFLDSQYNYNLRVNGETAVQVDFSSGNGAPGSDELEIWLGRSGNTGQGFFKGQIGRFRTFDNLAGEEQCNLVRSLDLQGAQLYPLLNQLRLVEGLPFNYLVPDEAMLPTESMRVFRLDPNWVASLLDGAFSIGRTSDAHLSQDASSMADLGIAPIENLNGIIIRSAAISGWPDAQVAAYSSIPGSGVPDPATFLPCLRQERLAENTLLCIFRGEPQSFEVHLPAETLHYGVDSSNLTSSYFQKVIRDDEGNLTSNYYQDNFTDTVNQVIGLASLAELIGNQDPAIFAMEMIEGVADVRFNL